MKAFVIIALIFCIRLLSAGEILLLSGEIVREKIAALKDGAIELKNGKSYTPDQIGKVVFLDRKELPHGPHQLILTDGSVLTGRFRAGTGRAFRFRSDGFGLIQCRMREAGWLILKNDFRTDRAKAGEGAPHLIYTHSDADPHPGRILRFHEKQLEYSMLTHTQLFRVDGISALFMGETGDAPAKTVMLRNGEKVSVREMRFSADRITVQWHGGERTLPLHAVKEIQFNHIPIVQEKTK